MQRIAKGFFSENNSEFWKNSTKFVFWITNSPILRELLIISLKSSKDENDGNASQTILCKSFSINIKPKSLFDIVLNKLGSNLESVPFIDINEGLQIDRCDIKKYMKNR